MRRLMIRWLYWCCAGWLTAVILPAVQANPIRDFAEGQKNYYEVAELIKNRYEQDVDFATLHKHAWISMEAILPVTDEQLQAAPDVGATSRELSKFYLDQIEHAVVLATREKKEDATPAISQLWNRAISGMVAGMGDPFSAYLPPKANEELQKQLSGEPNEEDVFYGVGISVDWDTETDQGLVVITPLPGTPAEENGISAGDIIVAVSDVWLNTLQGNFEEKRNVAIDMIKGKKDTEITLTLRKTYSPEPVKVTLKRAPINPNLLIHKEMLDKEIGWIHLYSFYQNAAEDVAKSLRYLKLAGVKKVIFDLRLNPGGYLDQAVDVADLFLKEGDLITYTYGRMSPNRYFYDQSTDEEGFTEMPMVILIHEWSASASEVVTGALKDNHRATVIGKTSFGKGSVQEVFKLEGGAGLRLTVAKYYTPSGVCIHEQGIKPDLHVDPITKEQAEALDKKNYEHVSRLERLLDRDVQLKKAIDFLHGDVIVGNVEQGESTPPSKG